MGLLSCFFFLCLCSFNVILLLSILTEFSANDNCEKDIMISVNLSSNYVTSMISGKVPVSLHSLYLIESLLGHL